MTTSTTPAHTPTVEGSVPAPPRLRRRPAVIGAGLALVAFGGLTAAWFATAAQTSTEVVVAAEPLLRGQTITFDQLSTADVSGLSPTAVTPADQLGSLVGKTAVMDVPAGAPVPGSALSDAAVPAAGESVVGILLAPGQVPTVDLTPGSHVRVVATPRSQDDPPATTPNGVQAVLVSTSVDESTGHTVANVSVPAAQGPAVAALAATGRAALVLDSASGGQR